ncbi:fungal peroxidase [Lentinula raphanica]|uniref:Fungal peroxidase n=1 Tax=Lentinula raphanica TaxID=153919 RepID=A0AA38P5A5_9AGAR|nr:fungal peroxidase [Lentinula raphanica]KAJ3836410.1 fungal peroxidase [Lentinula raphanica]
MKFAFVLLLAASAALQPAFCTPHVLPPVLKPRRTNSLLIDPAALPALPSAQQAATASADAGLNLTDIQGDILIGMKKNKELFFFFNIVNSTLFRTQLGSGILPLITPTSQLLAVDTQPTTAVNIAFSQRGLDTLGITDDLGDTSFSNGQLDNVASILGDETSNWESAFAGTSIHGVFLLASDTLDNVNATLLQVQNILEGSITEVYSLQGEARPGDQQGHEHFGFMDGISNPAVTGFALSPLPGQQVLDPGLFLLGETGDTVTRPAWAKDGSFLAFRQLQQRVPEFNKFLVDNALSNPNLTADQNAELLGARMMGRWKSGAPVDLAPTVDDPVLAADPQRNNNFNYSHPGFDITTDQTHCPFSAHLRKTNPRAGLTPENTANHIIRAGIPYGPEVTDAESASNTSSTDPSLERGLAFVAYQSDISNGFAFLQQIWANNAKFPGGKASEPGVDPIIGTDGSGIADVARTPSGLDPDDPTRIITIEQDFVVSRGGEYFFSPSLSAIQNTFAL